MTNLICGYADDAYEVLCHEVETSIKFLRAARSTEELAEASVKTVTREYERPT